MIHEFRVSNFFSIRDEVVLDLRIAGNAPDLPRFRESHSRPDVRLPTVAVIFGPNASGKSTVLRAITSVIRFACHSFDSNVGDPIAGFFPFGNDEAIDLPTKLMIEFDAAWLASSEFPVSSLFRYELELLPGLEQTDEGFVAEGVGQRKIVQLERLSCSPGGPPKHGRRRSWRVLFERESKEVNVLGKEFGMSLGDERLNAIKPNCSVISALAKLNNPFALTIWEDIKKLQSNLWGLNRNQYDNEQFQELWKYYKEHDAARRGLEQELARLDTGISRVEMYETPNIGLFPMFYHQGLDTPILYDEESSGTQQVIMNFPILSYVIASGQIAVIDEFDSDLHPSLVPEIFRLFQDPEINKNKAQLIVTAHNTQIMDELEKEEVFFVEKLSDGVSRLFGAQDIEGLRREPALNRKYMSGVLGALPNIG